MREELQDGTIRVLSARQRRRETAHHVSDRWLVAYAAAVGDTRPELFDVERQGGIIAHPVFPACLEWPLVSEGAPGIELTNATLNLGMHVAQSSVLHAPVVPGSTVTTVAELLVAEQRSNAVHIATEFTSVDDLGASVAVTRTHMLYPGAVLRGSRPHAIRPEAISSPSHLSPVGKFEVSSTNAVIYTECSRIWNPIHTDPRVAKTAGLSGPVLHGTETLARAISEVTFYYGLAVGAVTSYSCRFTAPVIACDHMVVMASLAEKGAIAFEVHNDRGTTVVANGKMQLSQSGSR